jgi:hypothetical protein
VTLVEAGVFVGDLVVLLAVSRALGLGLNPSWAWTYLVLPWLATRACTGLVADRKRLHEWGLSQLRYLLVEHRQLARLRPVREPAEALVRVRVWQPARRWDEMASLHRFQHEVSRRPRRGRVRGRWNGGAR